MTNSAADAARSAAVILAHDYGPNLPAQVEAALDARYAAEQRPGQYDVAAIASLGVGAASLIVTIAQLAWSIVTEHRKHTADPVPNSIARQVRITLHQQDAPSLPPGADRITEVVITEITRLQGPPGEPGAQA
jgi:hypothetical protein